jgi:DNA-binding XRE family transcriptional regulator
MKNVQKSRGYPQRYPEKVLRPALEKILKSPPPRGKKCWTLRYIQNELAKYKIHLTYASVHHYLREWKIRWQPVKNRLAILRIAAGYPTQKELADAMGTLQARISGWERGVFPKLRDLRKLAKALNCTLGQIADTYQEKQ